MAFKYFENVVFSFMSQTLCVLLFLIVQSHLKFCVIWDRQRWKHNINLYPTRVGTEILAHSLWKTWVLFEQEKILLWSKQHFVENETGIMQDVFAEIYELCFYECFPMCLSVQMQVFRRLQLILM
jgi:hypothetical protein